MGLKESVENAYYGFMDFLEQKLHIPAVKYFVEPLEARGIPSLPIFILVIAFILLTAFFLFSFQQPLVQVKVSVSTEYGLADDAVVEVLDGGNVVSSQKYGTPSGGFILLEVPKKNLVFRARKQGFLEASKQLAVAGGESIELKLAATTYSFSVDVVDSETRFPIEGAEVSYRFASKQLQAFTDSNGAAKLEVPQNAELSLKITASGYKGRILTLTAAGARKIISLDPIGTPLAEYCELHPTSPECITPVAPSEVFGTVVVEVTDENASPVQNGTVRVYDAESGISLGSASIESGSAVLEEMPFGANVFVGVYSDGFLPYEGRNNVKRIESSTTFLVVLVKATAQNSLNTTIKVVDESNEPVSATVLIASAENPASILAQNAVEGTWSLRLAPGTYVAYASAEGLLPARGVVAAGGTVTLILGQATQENSAQLNVTVVDEEENQLYSAGVGVFEEDAGAIYLAAPTQFTSFDGTAFFTLPLNKNYFVRASYSGENIEESIFLDSSKSLELIIELNYGFLNISGVDAFSTQPITASYSSQIGGKDYSSCTGFSCLLRLRSYQEAETTGKSDGFFDFVSRESVSSKETKPVTARFIPLDSPNSVVAEFVGVFDSNENPVESVDAGREYKVKINLVVPGSAQKSGIYLRVGSSQTVEQESAGILSWGYEDADQARVSTRYSPSAVCNDVNYYTPVDGLLKWVELSFNSPVSREFTFMIKAKPNAGAQPLQLFYRGFAVKDGAWLRNPFDSELGIKESGVRASCYAEASLQEISVNAAQICASDSDCPLEYECIDGACVPTTPPGPTCTKDSDCSSGMVCRNGDCVYAPITKEFTSNASIWFDSVEGRVKSDVTQIILQADAVLPADAMPLNITGAGGCPLDSLGRINSKGENAECYSIDRVKKTLVFKSNELNADCPIRVVGDVFRDGRGNVVSEDSSAALYSTCGPSAASIEIPIKVKLKTAPALVPAPASLSSGPYSTKLAYVLTQMQSGQTGIKLKSSSQEVSSDYSNPRAKAFAWTPAQQANAVLDLFEETYLLKEWTYPYSASYFEGVGDLGERVSACGDYLCCAGAWCTAGGFSQALEAFKQTVAQLSGETAFRRGNGEPAHSLGIPAFNFNTVAQLVEGVSPALFGIDTAQLPGSCVAGNPGIYLVKASSADGLQWSYSAEIAALSTASYIGASGQSMPLCNFLSGTDNEPGEPGDPTPPPIISDPVSNPVVSHNQLSDNEIYPVPSWFVPLIPKIAACKSATPVFAEEKTVNDASWTALGAELATAATSCKPLDNDNLQTCVTFFKKISAAQAALAGKRTEFTDCLNTKQEIASCKPAVDAFLGTLPMEADLTACNTGLTATCAATAEACVACLPACSPTFATACLSCDPSTVNGCCFCCACCGPAAAALTPCAVAFDAVSAASTKLSESTAALVAKGKTCENAKGWGADLPGIIPPRKAWLTCYPYATPTATCKLTCETRMGLVTILPLGNQIYAVLHFGLSKSCTPTLPSLQGLIKGLAPGALYTVMGQQSSSAASSGLMVVQDLFSAAFNNNLGLFDSSLENIPKKGEEDAKSPEGIKKDQKALNDYLKTTIKRQLLFNLMGNAGGMLPLVGGWDVGALTQPTEESTTTTTTSSTTTTT